ncbi:hypothetical protein XENOCAPTIV_014907, partial [Xenoophorus captivus]
KESEKRNVTVQADDPISFMQLTAKNEMSSKEDQFQLSLLAAMGNTQRKEAADPLASKLNKALSGFCGFMAANLYARSIFGEDALANVSIEKPIHLGPDAPVTGHIRIRAKSQVGPSCRAPSW